MVFEWSKYAGMLLKLLTQLNDKVSEFIVNKLMRPVKSTSH